MRRGFLISLMVSFGGCVQTTGGALVEFNAVASGPSDAVEGQPYTFTSSAGFEVTLTEAKLFVGAVYLNQTNPGNYTAETACILPGIYSGEVKGSLLVDALNPAPQPFAAKGVGTDGPTLAGELWLTSGDVNAEKDSTVVLRAAGTAVRGAETYPFSAAFTIGPNRRLPPSSAALPGSNPICKQRIVSPISAPMTLRDNGTLRLRVLPRRWFDAVDFAKLLPSSSRPGQFEFFDELNATEPDKTLYDAMRATSGPYELTFSP